AGGVKQGERTWVRSHTRGDPHPPWFHCDPRRGADRGPKVLSPGAGVVARAKRSGPAPEGRGRGTWRVRDSNPRRLCQLIYSQPPLATRVTRRDVVRMEG